MIKSKILLQLMQGKIVAVIRGNSQEEAFQAAQACIKGGISAIEIAYTIAKLAKSLNN